MKNSKENFAGIKKVGCALLGTPESRLKSWAVPKMSDI
jgi:hypothetical protein